MVLIEVSEIHNPSVLIASDGNALLSIKSNINYLRREKNLGAVISKNVGPSNWWVLNEHKYFRFNNTFVYEIINVFKNFVT